MAVPLILTLMLEEDAAAHFTSLRDKYFPPERNYLKAHITLFHHLPDTRNIEADLETLAAGKARFKVKTSGLMFLGNGFAVKILSEDLLHVHGYLQGKWWLYLNNQDKQKLRPHITIQNKVSPDHARRSMNELASNFTDYLFGSTGLALWQYLEGPWKLKREFKWQDEG